MKKKLLILSSDQFGYLTDTLKYCEYAADAFEITYVGWDYGKPRVELTKINIVYVPRCSNLLLRNYLLLKTFHSEINKGYDIVFATYTRGISIIRFLNPGTKFLIDIRTLCVNPVKRARIIFNFFLKLEISFFSEVSVISDGVAKKMNLKKYHLLPVGGECFSFDSKSYTKLSLLYVGTLQNRNILDCVKGFHLFLNHSENKKSIPTFTIVGNSSGNELSEISEYVRHNCLDNSIRIIGSIPQNELRPYFENANIGVSYIPLISYYNYQPPTKTFEYLISGLPVIATSTYENIKMISKNSGVLIEDNADSFFEGLKKIEEQKYNFDSDILRKLYAQYNWENLVVNKFIPTISGLI